MTHAAKLVLSLTLAFGVVGAAALLPADALAQGAPGLNNPLNRNPQDRSSVPDTAPVTQDARNSSTRPTESAAPSQPDVRNADVPPADSSRDTTIEPLAPASPDAIAAPAPPGSAPPPATLPPAL